MELRGTQHKEIKFFQGQEFQASAFQRYPQYDPNDFDLDIAVITIRVRFISLISKEIIFITF